MTDRTNSERYDPVTGTLMYYGMLPWPVEVGVGANGAAWILL